MCHIDLESAKREVVIYSYFAGTLWPLRWLMAFDPTPQRRSRSMCWQLFTFLFSFLFFFLLSCFHSCSSFYSFHFAVLFSFYFPAFVSVFVLVFIFWLHNCSHFYFLVFILALLFRVCIFKLGLGHPAVNVW
jgi:hypothetical protein